MSQERAREEKLLGKLQWLTERSKRDYKGNPPPFENRKTRQTVEADRQRIEAKRAGDTRFRPFWHGPPTLAEDAARLSHLHGCVSDKFSAPARNAQRNQETVGSCLIWNDAVPVPCKAKAGKPSLTSHHTAATDACSINCMSPAEKAAAYRSIIIKHPKVRKDSIANHHDRWQRGTQLCGVMLTHPK